MIPLHPPSRAARKAVFFRLYFSGEFIDTSDSHTNRIKAGCQSS